MAFARGRATPWRATEELKDSMVLEPKGLMPAEQPASREPPQASTGATPRPPQASTGPSHEPPQGLHRASTGLQWTTQ
ncbi:unnamed protein product [Boreogadus saida]